MVGPVLFLSGLKQPHLVQCDANGCLYYNINDILFKTAKSFPTVYQITPVNSQSTNAASYCFTLSLQNEGKLNNYFHIPCFQKWKYFSNPCLHCFEKLIYLYQEFCKYSNKNIFDTVTPVRRLSVTNVRLVCLVQMNQKKWFSIEAFKSFKLWWLTIRESLHVSGHNNIQSFLDKNNWSFGKSMRRKLKTKGSIFLEVLTDRAWRPEKMKASGIEINKKTRKRSSSIGQQNNPFLTTLATKSKFALPLTVTLPAVPSHRNLITTSIISSEKSIKSNIRKHIPCI